MSNIKICPLYIQNSNASRGACVFKDGKLMQNSFLVLDTPIVMHQGLCQFDEFDTLPGIFGFPYFSLLFYILFSFFSCIDIFLILFFPQLMFLL